MTALSLKAKSSVQTGGWSSIFTSFNTEAKSFVFIKQLTSVCISTILHLRKVLSEDYFEEKNFEGLTLKLLKPRKGDNYVTKIEQWLEGAFEAVEKKYLKRLMLDIQDAKSSATLEVYTITFNYSKQEEELTVPPSATSTKKSGFTSTDTEINTIKLLEMCSAVTKAYSNLPSQVKLSIRLSYYENTPDDYQPKGYMAWESVSPEFLQPARCIELGVTSTQYHFFKFINKSCLNENFFEDLARFESSNSTLPLGDNKENDVQERQTKAKRELCFDSTNSTIEKEFSPPSTSKNTGETLKVDEKFTSIPNQKQREKNEVLNGKARKNVTIISKTVNIPTQAVEENQKVRCACLSSDKSETMFSCLNCKLLVHAECYGILHFDTTRKIRFYCHLCHQPETSKCHDKVLLSLKNSSDQQKLCILRKVLRYCNTGSKITMKKIEKIAGTTCPKNVVIVVLNKLIEIGVAECQKRRKSYLINKSELHKKLPHYFYKVHDSNQSQHQASPYSLRSLENFKRKSNLHNLPFNNESKQLTVEQAHLPKNSQTSQQSCDIFY